MPSTTRDPDRHPAKNRGAPGRPIATRPEPTPAGTRIDAGDAASVLFAATDGTGDLRDTGPVPSRSGGREGHGLVAVGPGIADSILLGGGANLMSLNPLPIQGAKIHRPPLRNDILSRERLNGWLEQAAAGRLALIVAEAGFGKTTLLADWARHTARLTAWYRLEHDDRDWLTFIRHLVGSGRELDPEFAPETYGLLLQLGPGGPTQADIVTSLVHEIEDFGAATPHGLTLIFDDYHVVDGSDETDPIVRAILDHTGPGFSVVIASRSNPKIPMGRLRARGAVTRLDGDGLCFDVPEADRLFRDAYHQPLDADVISDLIQRTEGWAALLSLVRTNLEESKTQDPRDLVRQLSGGRGDLYDYVAEEVVDKLPADLSHFLSCASLLDEVDADAARVVTALDERAIAALTSTAEELGLLARLDVVSPLRYMPMVRDFFVARLTSNIGAAAVREMHLALGEHYRGRRWRPAATYFDRAGAVEQVAQVIEESLDEILGRGEYRAAMDMLGVPTREGSAYHVLRSRLLLQIGGGRDAVAAAHDAVASAEAGPQAHLHLALLNAASVATAVRHHDDALHFAGRAESIAPNVTERQLAEGYRAIAAASASANLPAMALQLERLLAAQERREQWHYAAVTSLNLAQVLVWLDRPWDAIRLASDADRLFASSSKGYERLSVGLAMAQARARLGDWTEAERLLETAIHTGHPEGRLEAIHEAASLASWYGPPGLAAELLARAHRGDLTATWALHWQVLDLWSEENQGRRLSLLAGLPEVPPPSAEVGASFRWHLTVARAHQLNGDEPAFASAMSRAATVAAAQRSPLQARLTSLLTALADKDQKLSQLLQRWPVADDAPLGVFAQEICSSLGNLTGSAIETVARASQTLPQRWRTPLRGTVTGSDLANAIAAAALLDQVGQVDDISLLREFGKRTKHTGRSWGDELIRRVAPRVLVDDLGLMSISIGDRDVDGRAIRRKVLALIAFLGSQPSGSATPDQVLEALWPELDPEQGTNSLHQTIYFLRRVIDPGYRAGISPEYLHFDPEVVWLDASLIDYRSWQCRRLLRQRTHDRRTVEAILNAYRGKFAGDFAYEEWATQYRDSLHAQFLAVMERAVTGDTGSSDLSWRLWVGQQALAIDPEADAIEAQVIKLYRSTGSAAAAAEQYAHYASLLRDQLGVEAPDLDDL